MHRFKSIIRAANDIYSLQDFSSPFQNNKVVLTTSRLETAVLVNKSAASCLQIQVKDFVSWSETGSHDLAERKKLIITNKNLCCITEMCVYKKNIFYSLRAHKSI